MKKAHHRLYLKDAAFLSLLLAPLHWPLTNNAVMKETQLLIKDYMQQNVSALLIAQLYDSLHYEISSKMQSALSM